MNRSSYVYMLSNGHYGALYVGVTSDLIKRVWQHREGFCDGFTKARAINKLVWYEIHGDIYQAITREKRLKKWQRAWKVKLISDFNPTWRDLYGELI